MPLRKAVPDWRQPPTSSTLPCLNDPIGTPPMNSEPCEIPNIRGIQHTKTNSLSPKSGSLPKSSRRLSFPLALYREASLKPKDEHPSPELDTPATATHHAHKRSTSNSIYISSGGALASSPFTAQPTSAKDRLAFGKRAFSHMLNPIHRSSKVENETFAVKTLQKGHNGSETPNKENIKHERTEEAGSLERATLNSHARLQDLLTSDRISPIEAICRSPGRYSGQDAHMSHKEMKLGSRSKRRNTMSHLKSHETARSRTHPNPLGSSPNPHHSSIKTRPSTGLDTTSTLVNTTSKIESVLDEMHASVVATPRFHMTRAQDHAGRYRLSLAPKMTLAIGDNRKEEKTVSNTNLVQAGAQTTTGKPEVDGTTKSFLGYSFTPYSSCSRFLAMPHDAPTPGEAPPSPTVMVLEKKQSRQLLRQNHTVSFSNGASPASSVKIESHIIDAHRSPDMPEPDDLSKISPSRLARSKRSRSVDLRGQFQQRNVSPPPVLPNALNPCTTSASCRRHMSGSDGAQIPSCKEKDCPVCGTMELLIEDEAKTSSEDDQVPVND